MFKKTLFFILLFFCIKSDASPLHIVAAENFYGQIAEQLGGQYVHVDSIMSNPRQDPHLFSINPAIAKAVAQADLIIYNGLGYDDWMGNLVISNSPKKAVIIVADLANKKTGDNPHIWYDPTIMLAYATHLTAQLSILDKIHEAFYQKQLKLFKGHYQILMQQINHDKSKMQNTPVIATEPVFDEMAKQLGLTMYGLNFQLSIMNDTAPSAADIKDFQNNLTNHHVKVLITNNQVSDPLAQRMVEVAQQANIPSIGVSELEPVDQNYFMWMSSQLKTLEKALGV